MTIHLIYASLSMRAFNRWAGNRGLIRHGAFDEGYALHILLSAMFGKAILQPFRLFASQRRTGAALYAYADLDASALRDTAHAVATPDCLDVIDVRQIRSKAVPDVFRLRRRLGFDVRVRPVRRLRRDLMDSQANRLISKGSEMDAFRLEAMRRCPNGWADPRVAASKNGVSRESVYAEWLGERFGDAVAVEQCKLVSFRRSRVIRGKGRGPEGPDATLHGTLAVSNSKSFARILRKGVGRHRAYGYGMLLLRPPRATRHSSSC